MIELVANDFQPLKEVSYLRRWMEDESQELSHPELAQIRPLKAEKAQTLWEYALVYFQELSRYLFADQSQSQTSSLFIELQRIDLNHEPLEESLGKVQRYLELHQLPEYEKVLVMLQPTEAVVVSWQVVYDHWDYFSDPRDEAVAIMPLSECWMLLYYHEDLLILGKPRQPLLDQEARERAVNPPARPLVHRDEVLRLLRANKKIAAIKLYHQETGVGLKQAKDVVDALLKEMENE